jgi:hypothetical protein
MPVQKKGDTSRRKCRRFVLEFPMEISGIDEQGHPFKTTARIRNASPEGGCLIIDKDIPEGTILKLVSPKGLKFEGVVCWESYSYHTNHRLIGFVLTAGQEKWVLGGHRPSLPAQKRHSNYRFKPTLLKKIMLGIDDLVPE